MGSWVCRFVGSWVALGFVWVSFPESDERRVLVVYVFCRGRKWKPADVPQSIRAIDTYPDPTQVPRTPHISTVLNPRWNMGVPGAPHISIMMSSSRIQILHRGPWAPIFQLCLITVEIWGCQGPQYFNHDASPRLKYGGVRAPNISIAMNSSWLKYDGVFAFLSYLRCWKLRWSYVSPTWPSQNSDHDNVVVAVFATYMSANIDMNINIKAN